MVVLKKLLGVVAGIWGNRTQRGEHNVVLGAPNFESTPFCSEERSMYQRYVRRTEEFVARTPLTVRRPTTTFDESEAVVVVRLRVGRGESRANRPAGQTQLRRDRPDVTGCSCSPY